MYCFKLYFLFRNKENKLLFGPPPPRKKRRRDTNGRNMATRTYVLVYTSSLCPEFLLGRNKLYGSVKLESNHFLQNYLIIVVFHAHITAFLGFSIQYNTISFIASATHFIQRDEIRCQCFFMPEIISQSQPIAKSKIHLRICIYITSALKVCASKQNMD